MNHRAALPARASLAWIGLLTTILLAMLALGLSHNFDFRYGHVGTGDWIAYWSIPRAPIFGDGFYDLAWLADTQQALGYGPGAEQWDFYPVRRLWNPPILLPLLLPLTLLPFTPSLLLWLGLSCFLYAHAAVVLNRHLPHPLPPAAALLLPFGLLPFLRVMLWGQVGLVLGACLVYAWLAYRRGRTTAAGVLLVPLFLKPHLFVAVLVLFGGQALRHRQWRLPLATLGIVGLLVLATFLLDPHWLQGWATQGPPLAFRTFAPLDLASLLTGQEWLRTIGILMAAGWALWHLRQPTLTVPLVAKAGFLSIVLAPYQWYHDLSVLLLPMLWMASLLWQRPAGRLLLLIAVGLNGFALAHVTGPRYLCYFASLLVAWLWSVRRTDRATANAAPRALTPVDL